MSYIYIYVNVQQISNAFMEERINWHLKLPTPTSQLTANARLTNLVRGRPNEGSENKHVDHNINKSLAAILTLRGNESMAPEVTKFNDPRMYCDWAEKPLVVQRHSVLANQDTRAATIWSNCQAAAGPLDRLIVRAHEMFSNGAYLHHYSQYGVDQPAFEEAFVSLEQALLNYQLL